MLHYVRILWCFIHEQKSCSHWSKLTCWLQKIIGQMWHSSFLLRSPGWSNPAQQRPFGKCTAAEVRSTRSGLSDSPYKDLHNHRNRQRWRNFVLNESQIHMERQMKPVDFPKQQDWCWLHREKRPYQGLHRTPRELLTLEDNPFLKCLPQEEQFGT